MKFNKLILLLLIVSIIAFAFVSCSLKIGGDGNSDNENEDNGEDNNDNTDGDGQPHDTSLHLVENGVAKFQIVTDKTMGSAIFRTASNFAENLNSVAGIKVEVVDDYKDNATDCEILVGDIKNRGDKYNFDEHTLGKEGYAVKRIDNKIIIASHDLDSIIREFERFIQSAYAALQESNGKTFNFSEADEVLKIQDNYATTSLSMAGSDIRGYTIAVDKNDTDFLGAARMLQDELYTRTGYWFDIQPLSEAGRSIVLKSASKSENFSHGFEILGKSDGKIEILCSYANALADSILDFLDEKLVSGAVNFNVGRIFKKDVSRVYYSSYPELTDKDPENDFEALCKAHEYANRGGQTVYAENGATYHISATGKKKITIKTDVFWDGATFVIDDTHINRNNQDSESGHIFIIEPDTPSKTYTVNSDIYGIIKRINENGGIRTTDKEIPLNLGYDAMILPYDFSNEMYRRCSEFGVASISAPAQREVIVVNADNTVDQSTRPLFDFQKVDQLVIYRIDDRKITLSGGKFLHSATRADMVTLNRGIGIGRSNVTITGMDHEVINQPVNGIIDSDSNGARYNGGGPNYNGWIVPTGANNLLVENTKLSGRAHYRQGSYDIGGGASNKIVFRNCDQYYMYVDNDQSKGVWNESRYYWGIMGTSYCKNIEYHDSTLSRLDAHAGVYNVVVKNCFMRSICAVGGGIFDVENTTVYATNVVGLRQDFGATWRGDVTIKDCTLISSSQTLSAMTAKIHNVAFGYTTMLPTHLYIENLRHYDLAGNKTNASLYAITMRMGEGYFDSGALVSEDKILNYFVPIQKITVKQPSDFELKDISYYPNENYGFKLYEEKNASVIYN